MTGRTDGKDLLALWQEATGENDGPLQRLLKLMLQRLLEEEMTEFLGAAPHQRTEGRRGYHNGHRPRTVTMRVGKV